MPLGTDTSPRVRSSEARVFNKNGWPMNRTQLRVDTNKKAGNANRRVLSGRNKQSLDFADLKSRNYNVL